MISITTKKITSATSAKKGKVHVGVTGNTVSGQKLPKNQLIPALRLGLQSSKILSKTMSSFTNTTTTLLHAHKITTSSHTHHIKFSLPLIRASFSSRENQNVTDRRKFTVTFLATSLALGLSHGTPPAQAENWGTRSFILEHFFQPGLSAEDSAARIKQTAEGMHSIREMLERMAWRYVIFYIRLKESYLNQDLKAAMSTLPQALRKDYVKTANDLLDNMNELDNYVRTPKVYESYLYYEKVLKNLDDIVAMLA